MAGDLSGSDWQLCMLVRIGKTAYGTQNENSANRHAVDFQLWNIDRNAGADNIIRKIDEKIDFNGIV